MTHVETLQIRSQYDRLGQRLWQDMDNTAWDANLLPADEFQVYITGLPRSMSNADQCRSIPLNADQCRSIPLNADQCRSMPDH